MKSRNLIEAARKPEYRELRDERDPLKKIVPAAIVEWRPEDRSSPCAGKCRHAWCAGYHAAYWEGYDDGRADVANDVRSEGSK